MSNELHKVGTRSRGGGADNLLSGTYKGQPQFSRDEGASARSANRSVAKLGLFRVNGCHVPDARRVLPHTSAVRAPLAIDSDWRIIYVS